MHSRGHSFLPLLSQMKPYKVYVHVYAAIIVHGSDGIPCAPALQQINFRHQLMQKANNHSLILHSPAIAAGDICSYSCSVDMDGASVFG